MGTLRGKVAVVTGSNVGIGLETARGLYLQGATVILACRDVGKAAAAKADITTSQSDGTVEVMALDLANKASIRAFAGAFTQKHPALHILVNNAGLWPTTRQTTVDGFELTFGTNFLGPFLLTSLLLPALRAGAPSRVVNVSSSLHRRGKMDFEDPMFERRPYSHQAAYNQSKLCNVMFTAALARRLAGSTITVNAVHPGVVVTQLARDFPPLLIKVFQLFLISPQQGALTSLHVATSAEGATTTGAYFEKSRVVPAAPAALDVAAQERLWQLSEKLLGVTFGV